MRIVDLTIPMSEEVTPVTGQPRTERSPIITPGYDHISNTLLVHSLHTGTHVDAPKHFIPGGQTIDQVDLNRLIGKTFLIDVHDFAAPGQALSVEDLKRGGCPEPEELRGNRILVYANWCAPRWRNGPLYGGQTHLQTETARWLRDAGIAAFAADFPVDGGQPYPNHPIMLGAGIPLIENLINLDQIDQRIFTLWALPLKIANDNGAPARVLAVLD